MGFCPYVDEERVVFYLLLFVRVRQAKLRSRPWLGYGISPKCEELPF